MFALAEFIPGLILMIQNFFAAFTKSGFLPGWFDWLLGQVLLSWIRDAFGV